MQTNYINSLTPLRGFAAIWVMIFHIDVIIFYRGFGFLVDKDVSGIISKGYLWVDFFFILSGFVISHVYGDALNTNFGKWSYIKSYLWARFSRIYPLHLFTLLFLVPFALIFPLISPEVKDGSWLTFLDWTAFFQNLFLLNAMGFHVHLSWNIVAWSIGAEWWTYLIAAFIIPFLYKKSWLNLATATILAIVILFSLIYIKGDLDITYNQGWIRCVAEFTIGSIIYQLYLKRYYENWLNPDAIFVITVISICLIFHFKLNDLLIIPIFCLLILTSAFNSGIVKNLLESKILRYLGDISYSIYMMHGVWFMVFWFGIPYLKSEWGIETLKIWMKLAFSVSFIGLTLLSAHFTYLYIEIKSRDWLRKII